MATITAHCAQLAPREARGSAALCGWRWGAGAPANKSPMSEITAANKQTEAARDGLAFFKGIKQRRLIKSLSCAVRGRGAVISGKLFVSVQQ